MTAYFPTDFFQLNLNSILNVLHTTQWQLQCFHQIDSFISGNKFETFRCFGVINTSIDGHEHEGVRIANIVEAGLNGRQKALISLNIASRVQQFTGMTIKS